MSARVASARMYGVTAQARAAWAALFARASERAGVPLDVIEHAFPAPLADLWGRPDLGAAFMCGWPFVRGGARHRVIAAPLVDDPETRGAPLYRTHFVVAAKSPFRSLADTYGHRLAFTVPDSHSGYNAPRYHLLAERQARGGAPLFAETIGPLVTPRRVLEAIVAGDADVGPLDSYAFLLFSRHEPDLAGKVRIVASTAYVPIPPIVAAPDTPDDVAASLTRGFTGLSPDDPAMRTLALRGFTAIEPAGYAVTQDWADAAEQAGLAAIG